MPVISMFNMTQGIQIKFIDIRHIINDRKTDNRSVSENPTVNITKVIIIFKVSNME